MKTNIQQLIDTINEVKGDSIDKKMLLAVLKLGHLPKEKQQIIDAFYSGTDREIPSGEEYFNQTYNNNEK